MQYDEYGLPMQPDQETGFDYQKHIVTDDLRAGDMYIEAPPEMIAQMHALPKPGIRRDIDKDPSKMTAEEREVFNCLEEEEFDENHVYEELEDDFLFLANEGQPALTETKPDIDRTDDKNAGVVIFKDEEEEKLK